MTFLYLIIISLSLFFSNKAHELPSPKISSKTCNIQKRTECTKEICHKCNRPILTNKNKHTAAAQGPRNTFIKILRTVGIVFATVAIFFVAGAVAVATVVLTGIVLIAQGLNKAQRGY